MTLDEAVALVAVYLGEADESKINGMSIPFFNSVLTMLGKRVNYDAVVNYAGNSFAKDSWKLIQEANPFTKQKKVSSGFLDLLSKATSVQAKEKMGDISWAT